MQNNYKQIRDDHIRTTKRCEFKAEGRKTTTKKAQGKYKTTTNRHKMDEKKRRGTTAGKKKVK